MTQTRIPQAQNLAARRVVIKHPNSVPCQVFRMIVNRAEPLSGGVPTIGGLGIMTPDDEWDYSWQELGVGWALRAQPFDPSIMMDRQDANNSTGDDFRYMIEPVGEPFTEGWFDIKNQDVVYLTPFPNIKLAFEIVGQEAVTDMFPYATRYILQRSDRLDVVPAN
jgi:hypothetical protein